MPFTRRWMRDSLRASAVTMLVPAGLLIALLVTALGSGFTAFGSLRQLVSGPTLPNAVLISQTAAPRRGSSHLPLVPAAPGTTTGTTTSTPTATTPTQGVVGAPAPGRVHRLGSSHGPAVRRIQRASRAPSTTPARRPSSPAPAGTGPVHNAGQMVQQTVSQTSPALAPSVNGAVGTVENLVPPGQ